MALISRYILREAFGAWLVVAAVLFVILMSNQFAAILGDAAADRLPRDAVLQILGLTSLRYVTVLMPFALFLGIMLALARLNRDCETVALSACGIGPARVFGPVSVLTLVLAAVVSWLALVETPEASQRIQSIKAEAKEAMQLEALEPGRFTTPDSGDSVLYVRDVAGDQINDVFWYRRQDGGVVAVLAERGRRIQDPKTGDVTYVLYDGRRYEVVPGEKNARVVEFAEHGIPVRGGSREEPEVNVDSKPTPALLGSADPEDRAELQWRLSAPLSLFILALLAVPLSQSSPREGRYGRLGAGLLVMFTYTNVLSIARVWVEREQVPYWLGLWWVHAALALFALVLFARSAGWFVRGAAEPGVVTP